MATKKTAPPPEGALPSLKKGTYTLSAPAYLGGVVVTLRAGEPVAPEVFAHVPEADRALFTDAPAESAGD